MNMPCIQISFSNDILYGIILLNDFNKSLIYVETLLTQTFSTWSVSDGTDSLVNTFTNLVMNIIEPINNFHQLIISKHL
jgi:hypothetical protein